ncbi:MAG TPA: tripartite tricarboxylate transporter permease [Paracoccus sp. (in: a-proteobacteria)]|uniref:tripartite tricarboxylate transporter permease n=1 Tax=Paracoccus sp. TaxID=267 RepID=UPI002C442F5D|nr:tripartite tricarboxylate transporter permease [Paracoccus sp. (in: a-proteobacteria)]HWL55873.1 tripartite tricarboxylate transporter permease [Paracoccus sp. (in: a-proteobacteria)]
MLENILLGFAVAFSLKGLFYCGVGVLLGTVVGVLPGLGSMATLAMLMPITYHIDSNFAVIMLAGIYYGAAYGGSTASILLNLPGTVTSVVTTLDGYPMARNGKAGLALFITAIASFVGSMVGAVLLAGLTVPLASMAMRFGPQEYTALMIFGLIAASMLSTGQPLKSLIMVFAGMLLGLVGIDMSSGVSRYTFDLPELFDGLSLVAIALGLFGLPEIITTARGGPEGKVMDEKISLRSMLPTKAEWKESAGPIMRGTGIGSFFGALPGTGGMIATFISYAVERRLSKTPEKFGHGALAGVASPEAANNAAVQTAFIPTMSLGIPGDAVMAMMLGVLMVHGVIPGPQVITEHPDLFWGLVASFVVGNVLLVLLNIPLVGLWVRLLKVPYHLLYPVMIAFVCVGIYSVRSSVLDLYILLGAGLVGIVLKLLRFESSTLLLGFVLGPMIEENFRRAMTVTNGDFSSFLSRPIAAIFVFASLAIVGFFVIRYVMRRLMPGQIQQAN